MGACMRVHGYVCVQAVRVHTGRDLSGRQVVVSGMVDRKQSPLDSSD